MSNFISELEEIRQENTQFALFYINSVPILYKEYSRLKEEKRNLKYKSAKGLEIATEWAEKHNNMFGDLFQLELELVRWNKLLNLL